MAQEWDRVYKTLFEQELRPMLWICGIEVASDTEIEELPTEYRNDLRPDRVYRVGGAIVHIEIQSSYDADLERRLVAYWAAIKGLHGAAPRQIVLLPRGGAYTGIYREQGLTLTYDLVDLTTGDPSELAASQVPSLALANPLAGSHIPQVVRQLKTLPASHQRTQVDLALLVLANNPDLTTTLVQELRRNDMASTLLGQTDSGRELLEQGRTEGREQGRVEERAATTHLLLELRFGKDPLADVVAARLANYPMAEVISAINEADSIETLLRTDT